MELVNIKEVKNNEDNPRFIKDNKFKKLVKSIKEFPEMLKLRPIVVNKDMVVLGGNMRLKACKEAGLKEVWVLKADDLTEKQQREFIVKDNVGFGEWDWDTLANEWDVDQLDEWGLDVPDFPNELGAEEDDYEEPDDLKVDVVLGDLIEIGEHRLLCGDSTDSDQVAKLMNGEKADMVFTDPPYNVAFNGRSGKFDVIENDDSPANRVMNPKDYFIWVKEGSMLSVELDRQEDLSSLSKYMYKSFVDFSMPITIANPGNNLTTPEDNASKGTTNMTNYSSYILDYKNKGIDLGYEQDEHQIIKMPLPKRLQKDSLSKPIKLSKLETQTNKMLT